MKLVVDVREYLKGIVNVFVCFIDVAGFLSTVAVLVGELLRSSTWRSHGRRVAQGGVCVVERCKLICTSAG